MYYVERILMAFSAFGMAVGAIIAEQCGYDFISSLLIGGFGGAFVGTFVGVIALVVIAAANN